MFMKRPLSSVIVVAVAGAAVAVAVATGGGGSSASGQPAAGGARAAPDRVAPITASDRSGGGGGGVGPGGQPAGVAGRAAPASARVGAEEVAGRVVAVHVVSRVGASGAADALPRHARVGEVVTLFALVEVERAGRRELFSDAPLVRWRGRQVRPRPLAEAPAMTLRWNKIEPETANLSNTATGSFRYERIPYAATAMTAAGGAITADVRPTLTPDHGRGLGTMRFQVVATQGDRVVASPGVDARRGRGAGGLVDEVHRVSIRADDSFLGMLGEMYGQPYIWASAGGTDRTHQSERLEGSDCADLMVYGARRAGITVPYGWTGSLERHARVLGQGALQPDGVYRDRRGNPVPFTRPGDLVLFPRHVGALVEDRGVPGVLDTADLMLHTLFDSPRTQPIADSGYADNPVKVLRWKGMR